MWTQFIILAAAVSTACGMCFGVPPYKQSVACPPPMVYYAPLCVCLQPNHETRIQTTGTTRPFTMPGFMDPYAYEGSLSANRYRQTASLPDMPGYAFGSSLSTIRQSPLLFSDAAMTFAPISSNQLPRSWQIFGSPDFWTRTQFVGKDIPTISSAIKLLTLKDLDTIAMMDSLKMMRNEWRQRKISKAKQLYGASNFLTKMFPLNSKMMPDVVRSSFPSAAGELTKDMEGKNMFGLRKLFGAGMAQQQDLTKLPSESFMIKLKT